MDDDSKQQFGEMRAGMLGLGAIAACVAIPKLGLWIALVIIRAGVAALWRLFPLARRRAAATARNC